MKKKENEITIKTIWKWFRSEKGKRYSFVLFYLFFFLFLFLFLNVDLKTDRKEEEPVEETSRESSLPFETSNLEKTNYSFRYTVTCPTKQEYQGEKKDKVYTFLNSEESITYELLNGELKGFENKVPYADFSNVYFLRQILKNGKLISETKLTETEEYIYTYKMKNNILSNYLKDEDLNELETEINIKTDLEKKIEEVKIDLSNYKDENCIITYEVGEDNE